MIEINDSIKLRGFNSETDKWFIDEINGNSKSDFIHEIEERLTLQKPTSDEIELTKGYLVEYNGEIVGYVYFTNKANGKMYFEYLVLKQFRGQGIGSNILDNVTDYVLELNTDVLELRLSIDKSNLASMKAAESNCFILDEDTYDQDKLEFIKTNPYYVSRRRH